MQWTVAAPGTPSHLARVKLEPIGPVRSTPSTLPLYLLCSWSRLVFQSTQIAMFGQCFDMTLRRTQWAPEELAKQALRRPKSAHYKPKSIKNVRPDGMGDQIGRIHLDTQDLSKMALRRFKSLKVPKKPANSKLD